MSAGLRDAFLGHVGTDCKFKWAKRAGGPNDDFGMGLAQNGDGNVAVAGFHGGGAVFGPGEIGTRTLMGFGGADAFFAVFSNLGTFLAAREAGGAGGSAGGARWQRWERPAP